MTEVGAPGAGVPASAPAPAESSVPLPDSGGPRLPSPATGGPPAPSKDEVSQGQPPSGKERRSISDSVDKAFEAAKTEPKAEPKAKPEAKPEPRAKPEAKAEPATKPEPAKASPRERSDDGRFASSQPRKEPAAASQDGQAPHHQPPRNANFSPEAKAEWANTPETVKIEVHRRLGELEAGHHKYRADAEAYHELRPFAELAKASGTTLPKATANYVTIERAVASDNINEKLQGIERVLARGGLTPQQYASYILNQPQPTPDEKEAAYRQEITGLRNELASISQTVQGVASTQREEQTKAIEREVTSFAQSQPRFEELSAPHLEHSIQNLLQMPGMVPKGPPEQRLAKAYELAERLNPSASRSPPLVPESRPANSAGTKSIAGSPANGSDPTLPARKKGQRPLIKDSVDRAFARLGS